MTVQRRVQIGVDAANAPNYVWQDWRPDIPCEIKTRRGKEHYDSVGKKRQSEDVWQFIARFDEVSGIDSVMRLSHEGSLFDIKAILPDAQDRSDCLIEATLYDGVLDAAPLLAEIRTIIPDGIVGTVYDGITIEAFGGTNPYLFTPESGTMPPGLTLDVNTGTITGTPTLAGTYSVDVDISDADGSVETIPTFTIKIEAA